MKTSLTIEGTPAELANVLAMLGGNAGATPVHVVHTPVVTTINNDDDDESSDADATPGSVDKTGLPWDDRIHSTPAKLTNKGVWRAKRGVTAQLVQQVEAELRARGPVAPQPAAPAPQFTPPAAAVPMPQQPEQPVYQPQPQFTPQPVQQPAAPVQQPAGYPAPVPAPAPMQQSEQPVYQQPQPAAPAAAPAPGSVDFMAFMQKVAVLSQQGLADAAYFQNLTARISQAFQVPMPGGITELQKDQRMVDYAIQLMASEGKWA